MRKMNHFASNFRPRGTEAVRPTVWLTFVFLAAAFLVAPYAARASEVELSGIWKKGDYLKECTPPAKEGRFTVYGPGKIHVKITLKPYWSAGRSTNIPVSWTEVKPDGSITGWLAANQAPFYGPDSGEPAVVTQNGKPVRNYIDGVPLEYEFTWAVFPKEKHTLAVRLGGACAMMGSAGFSQWGQENHLVVSYSGGGSFTPIAGFAPVSAGGQSPQGDASANETQPAGVAFDNGNAFGVQNGPSRPTVFTIGAATLVTFIQDYHWNNGRGAAPGTISLKDDRGRIVGTWNASGRAGQGGGMVYWVCEPNVVLLPGSYTVVDSDPSTWSQNSGSGGAGMTHIEGHPKG